MGFFYWFMQIMFWFIKLFLKPFSDWLPVYGQFQFILINRIFLNLKNVILDVKLTSVFFGINPTIASDSFLFCQKTVYHIFGKSDGIT